jgi:hypothetical protein
MSLSKDRITRKNVYVTLTERSATDRLTTLITFRMTQANERNAVLSYSGGRGFKCVILIDLFFYHLLTACSITIHQ